MEFGIHSDYVPDYGVIYGLKQPFYLFDPCEENYKYVFFITEFGSFLTSFFLFVPFIYTNLLKPSSFLPQTKQYSELFIKKLQKFIHFCCRVSKNLFYSGLASLFYHGYVSYITQFLDMLTIMWTLLHVIYDFRIPFTNKQECVLVFMFFGGIFHPLLTAFSMLYLIFKVSGYFLRISLKKGRYITITPVALIIFSLSLIILDIILCPYQIFRYFHSIWHFTAFLAFAFLLADIEHYLPILSKEFTKI